jgi:hypothetical protein
MLGQTFRTTSATVSRVFLFLLRADFDTEVSHGSMDIGRIVEGSEGAMGGWGVEGEGEHDAAADLKL